MSCGVGCSIAAAKRMFQISGRRKRRVRTSAIVGTPTVSLRWLRSRCPSSDTGDHLGGGGTPDTDNVAGVKVGAVGQAAGALLVDEERVHPEVEQFTTVDIAGPGNRTF